MNVLKYILSHPQTLIAIVIIVGPILRGVLQKLKEQSAARQREIERERAQIEALRTGGRVDADQAKEVSARAALERRATQRRIEPRPAASRPVPPAIPGSTGPTIRPRPGAEPRVPKQTKRQQAAEPPAPRRETPAMAAMAAPEPSAAIMAGRQEEALAAANVATAVATASRSRAAWRRAIIMQELLGPPVSMR